MRRRVHCSPLAGLCVLIDTFIAAARPSRAAAAPAFGGQEPRFWSGQTTPASQLDAAIQAGRLDELLSLVEAGIEQRRRREG